MSTRFRIKVTLFIVLFLLLAAMAVYILMGDSERDYYNPNPIFQTAQTEAPSYTAAPVFPSAEPVQPQLFNTPEATSPVQPFAPAPAPDAVLPAAPTAVPAPTFLPIATPAPTPVPTATPQPAGMPLGSGSLASDSGTSLNIRADWSAVTADAGNAEVTVIVYAEHYSLYYNSFQSLFVSLGDRSQSLYANEIMTDSNEHQLTELGRTSFTVPLSQGEESMFPLNVEWRYNGVYGKDANGVAIELPVISCDGLITLRR